MGVVIVLLCVLLMGVLVSIRVGLRFWGCESDCFVGTCAVVL